METGVQNESSDAKAMHRTQTMNAECSRKRPQTSAREDNEKLKIFPHKKKLPRNGIETLRYPKNSFDHLLNTSSDLEATVSQRLRLAGAFMPIEDFHENRYEIT